MLGIRGVFIRLLALAGNTLRAATRQKIMGMLLVLAAGFVSGGLWLRQLNVGGSEVKFITDFGWGVIFILGAVFAIVATAQFFFSEIEHRTVLTVLAKPVARWEFLLGKFIGIALVLAVFTAALVLVLIGVVYFHASMSPGPAQQASLSYLGFVYGGILQWVKFLLLSAITLCICSFANTQLYAVMVALFVLLVCQLRYLVRDYGNTIDGITLNYVVMLLGYLFPNFQLFNAGNVFLFHHARGMPLSTLASIVGYGFMYSVFYLGMAVWRFGKRDLA